jgi:hypothetical protein
LAKADHSNPDESNPMNAQTRNLLKFCMIANRFFGVAGLSIGLIRVVAGSHLPRVPRRRPGAE